MFGRISTFIFGIVVGAAGLYTAQNYHIVRAEEGLHVIPKLSLQLGEAYVDIRQFDLVDWQDHKLLAAALVQADKSHLMQDGVNESLRDTLNTMINALGS